SEGGRAAVLRRVVGRRDGGVPRPRARDRQAIFRVRARVALPGARRRIAMIPPRDAAFWNEAEAIFSDALALEPAARAPLLAARCGDRADLRAEVQTLLEAHACATAFMRPVSSDAAADALPAGLREGDLVGAFRLVSRLASGGMGTVYVADRAVGDFAQRVAV